MKESASTVSTGNELLDSLSSNEFDRIQSSLKAVDLPVSQILSVQSESVEYVYFPATCLISCRAGGPQGDTIEIYAVGHEGVVEPAAILTSIAAVTAEVQIAGKAYRIKVDDLCKAIRETTELAHLLLKYSYSLAVRMVQATRCAMFHTVEQRLVLWLLLAYRAHGNTIPCTHQAIADALGARRASITQVLNSLAEKGILAPRRGCVTIRNRHDLEGAACDCYELIKSAVKPDLECDLLGARH